MGPSKAKTFRHIVYSSGTKGTTLLCGLLTSLVVARNLTPADYGVVGFATIVIAFLSRFSDMGMASAAIRQPALRPSSLHTAFTLKIMLSSGAFLLALLIAPFARHVFDHPATGNVIRVLALNFFGTAIGFVPLVVLTRQMNYRTLMIPGVAAAAVQAILAITLILRGWSYWAVVISNVGSTVASGILLQVIRSSPVHLRLDWEDAREYLQFGIPLFETGVLIFLIFNLDNFLIGTSFGSVRLGYYALAFTWGSFICVLLNDTVNNVLLPTLSTIQGDSVAMRRWYLKTIDLTAFVAVVANSVLLANAHPFLVTFLGKGSTKWIPAETSLKILCVYGIVRAITEVLGPCLMARGETKVMWRANLAIGAVELPLVLLALKSGRIDLVAGAVLVSYFCACFVLVPFVRRDLSISIVDIVAQLWPVVPALVAGYTVTSLIPTSSNNVVILAGKGLITASVVALTHGLFTGFRCFHEAGTMILPSPARARA